MLRRVRLAAFAFVVTFVVPACARERIELAAGITAAEMRFELIDNRIFLEARINGQRPYQFIFDTGGQNVLDPATARELGLALRDESSQIGAGAQAQRSWRTDVALAEIGPVRLRDHEFMVLDLATIRHAIGFRRLDGLVGRELFERFIVDIDFEGLKLRFIEPSGWTPSPAHGRRVPLAFVGGGIPSIDATIDGVRGELAIDTGDRSSLTLFSPFVARERLREKYARRISAVTGWGVGGPIPADVTRAERLSFGGFDIARVVARMPTLQTGVFASDISAGSIGNGVLKRFRATFDYGGKQLFLAPNASFVADDQLDRSGLWLSQHARGFEVMSVVAGSPAEQAGIKVGDVVTAVDGRTARDLFLVELRERLKRDPAGTVVRMKLERLGAVASLTLRDLL